MSLGSQDSVVVMENQNVTASSMGDNVVEITPASVGALSLDVGGDQDFGK